MWRPELPSLSLVSREAGATARRFPLVIGSALVAATYAIWLIGLEDPESVLIHVMFPLTLGIPLFLAVALYRESPRRPLRLDGRWLDIGALALLLVYFIASAGDETANARTRFAQLHLAAMLAVAFAGFTAPGVENGFWQFNRDRFFRFLLSAVYAGVCFVGLSLALGAIHKLFDVEFGRAYGRIWVLCAYVLLPWHFLASLPVSLATLDRDRDYPAPLRVFGQYLLMPLVLLYAAILYVYAGKIVVTRTWPQGLVAWMVSGMSIFGVLVLLLLHPYQRLRRQGWIRSGGRRFWILLLPLLVLHLTALTQRVAQYGFTEHRYIQLVLAVWLAGLSISFLTGFARNIKVVPMSLCALSLVTFLGPWSAYAVSRRSQTGRLATLLAGHGPKSGAVSWEEWTEIRNILTYLREWHGAGSLTRWTRHTGAVSDIMESLGLKYAPRRAPKPDDMFAFSVADDDRQVRPVSGYDGYRELRYDLASGGAWQGSRWVTRLEKGGRALLLERDGQPTARFDLAALARRLIAAHGVESDRIPIPEMAVTADSGYRLCLLALSGRVVARGITVQGGTGYLLFRRNPPR